MAAGGAGAAVELSPANALPAGAGPHSYSRHPLHGDDRIWVEKNCYVDVWIALLHMLGLEPRAMAGFTAAIDFLGDQWTFFKPPHDELRALYGIDVQELTLWRPLQDHAVEHLGAGRLISVEADAFWLPDTAGTDYRRKHSKSTIVLAQIDPAAGRLVYFHNTGLFELSGDDFRQTMANGGLALPLFAELLSLRRLVRRSDAELRRMAAMLLHQHAAWAAEGNPVQRFAARFATDLQALQQQPGPERLEHYHAWAFSTTRQLGAAAELLAEHLRWLDRDRHAAAADDFLQVAHACKTLILKAARAVHSGKPLDASELFDAMGSAWQRGSAPLAA